MRRKGRRGKRKKGGGETEEVWRKKRRCRRKRREENNEKKGRVGVEGKGREWYERQTQRKRGIKEGWVRIRTRKGKVERKEEKVYVQVGVGGEKREGGE